MGTRRRTKYLRKQRVVEAGVRGGVQKEGEAEEAEV